MPHTISFPAKSMLPSVPRFPEVVQSMVVGLALKRSPMALREAKHEHCLRDL